MSGHADITPELLRDAMLLLVNTQFGSQSMVQRQLRTDFKTAQQLMDELTDRGILGPADGSRAREVRCRRSELGQALAELDQATA